MITITHNQSVYSMSANHSAVCKVPVNTDICFETYDCFSNQIESVQTPFDKLDWNRINPATGPVYVEGALVGDILKVSIKSITITSNQAVMVTMPQLGVIGDELTETSVKIIPLKEGKALLPGNIEVPITPMIGVIGVAPVSDDISCGTPDKHGGNMDCKVIRAGTTLFLPVNVEGALLALGDLHAGMGDGEVAGCGLEAAGKVVLSIEVIKGKQYPSPMVVDNSSVYTIASELTLDAASVTATKNMVKLLTEQAGLSQSDAISLMSIVGDLQICQVVDPLKTCRFAMPVDVLANLKVNL